MALFSDGLHARRMLHKGAKGNFESQAYFLYRASAGQEIAMKRLWLLALGLSACASAPSLADIEQECRAGHVPFEQAWPCVKVGIGSINSYEDLKRFYVSTGDVVAERVRDGSMTEAEARLVMAKAWNAAADAEGARMGANRPQVVLPAPVVSAPSRQVNCVRLGNYLSCS